MEVSPVYTRHSGLLSVYFSLIILDAVLETLRLACKRSGVGMTFLSCAAQPVRNGDFLHLLTSH